MATKNGTEKAREALRVEEVGKLSDATYAVKYLGDLLRQSQENGGFDGLTEHHWVAIGISIEQLSTMVYRHPLLSQVEKVVEVVHG